MNDTFGELTLDINSMSELAGYIPFHCDLDIQLRVPQELENTRDIEEDPFLVKKIVTKPNVRSMNRIHIQRKYLGTT